MKLVLICCLFLFSVVQAARLASVTALDEQIIMVHFEDGVVERPDDPEQDPYPYEGHKHHVDGSQAVYFGDPLNTEAAQNSANWQISSEDHSVYSSERAPVEIHRKSKLNGMSMAGWDGSNNDWAYDHTMEHWLYLRLPEPMEQGKTYTISVGSSLNSDQSSVSFTYDIFSVVSEAIHVNLVGYKASPSIKAADLYHWMGDGGGRDYSDFEGNTVYIYDVEAESYTEVGTVDFWMSNQSEGHHYNFIESDVWNIDFTGFETPGRYRLAVEGIGASQKFTIHDNIYYEPLRVNTLGHFYMRVGQDSPDIDPRPRLPLMIPEVDNARVYVTTLHPYHPNWDEVGGDRWDQPGTWSDYTTGEENPYGWGGWSDAYDWDRHGEHVLSIWDILLPYILTEGALSDDDFGLAESGNGIPDVLDEARFEVDFFLRIRTAEGEYSHGLTNPYGNDDLRLYQAGGTALSAWYNAVNAAMMAEAFRISGNDELMEEYRDSAIVAYNFAQDFYDNQRLDDRFAIMEGRDMKMTAAAFLYNITGDTFWEDEMISENRITSPTSPVQRHQQGDFSQLYAIVAYATTPRTVHYPEVQENMRQAIINEAMEREATQRNNRPSRRSYDDWTGYWKNASDVQRTIVAHALSTDPVQKEELFDALILEADWGLGRNPSNFITMTTASTPLESIRSVEAAYTSGYNDGTPGLHPGHTPYHNMDDWAPGMIMGRPSWLAEQGYPAQDDWPDGELWFNTDYVWSHSEFTLRQTMRGKQALYGYLYGISKNDNGTPIVGGGNPENSARSKGSGYRIVVNNREIRLVSPANDAQDASLHIIDPRGRIVKSARGESQNGSFVLSSRGELSRGMYILRGQMGDVTIQRRMVVQ
ncbi:cellulase N-terminal Ig-like domain-containing protein [Chitinivibrio alkaliphilus]|uniref:Glycoside hydrolase, GH9 family n=1 Tax=Chitinivibrio alkaliphilus ACht1 TaxID=1313304 RepID=U7D9I1_9BACT|nr:cellulase N-terminal Ig-like domain-containing protein [Chitinivibrio alkaliphilus]ERP39049.1 glycoside hydrolase, GH9 family [Chitinivibrio alkaliphilus ACht1]